MNNVLQVVRNPLVQGAAAFAFLIGLGSGLAQIADGIRRPFTVAVMGSNADGVILKGPHLLDYGFVYGLLIALGFLVLLVVAVWGLARIVVRDHDSLRVATAEYDRTGDALRSILFKLYDSKNAAKDPPPRITFNSVECVFDIDANGDTRVTQTYRVQAESDPAHFWIVRIAADEFAKPIRTVRDLQFAATSTTKGAELEFLPLGTISMEKQIAVFFLPEIAPGASRGFEVRYAWRGWFGELFGVTQRTTWHWSYRSAKDNDRARVKFVFRFSSACGRILCENGHASVSGDQLKMTTGPQGETVWTFKNANCPIARMNWNLRFERS